MWRQKCPRGFLDQCQTRLPAQFPKEIDEPWQWFKMRNHWGGAGTAIVTTRLTKNAAKCGGRWDCFREGCTIAQPRSNLRCKSLAKQNQQNMSDVEPWQQKNMFLTPELTRICLGALLGHEARKGGRLEARLASSANKGPKVARANQHKKVNFSKVLCASAENTTFPTCGQNCKIFICTRFGVGAQISTKLLFLWHVGLVVCFL